MVESGTDSDTTIQQIKDSVMEFITEREWQPFHDPKNVAMALASEVGELLDLFRWVKSDQAFKLLEDKETLSSVREELADIAMFIFDFATICDIDLTEAVNEKMRLNAKRYPIEKARGLAKKYTQLGDAARD